jgi:leader peptidase (prepilin peptidase) / N-methyltransferase
MLRDFITIFAALAGLAFGSFLNVCLSRWPAGESVVKPGSHCRSCNRTLAWWENIPLLSWIALRGHCRTCNASISWRYPLVELSVACLWAFQASRFWNDLNLSESPAIDIALADFLAKGVFIWLLIALAALDFEHLWLPDWLTLTGAGIGFLCTTFLGPLDPSWWSQQALTAKLAAFDDILAILIAAGLILLIRWLYWLIRRREGIGLGDAKLMALLAAWLGLPGTLLSFVIGVVLGAAVALIVLARPASQTKQSRALTKLPLGTFLCIGGIITSLWGQQILEAYLRWSGLN